MAGGEAAQRDLRYEVNDNPPHLLALGLGAQSIALIIAGIVLTPMIVLKAAGVDAEFGPWAIFAAVLVSGLTTILQSKPVWRFGAGYVLFMGTSGAYISVCITAILDGGIAMMCTLIVVSALLQFPLAANLGLLRKIITPTIGGTASMLIAVTVMPIAFGLVSKAPDGVDPGTGIVGAAVSAGVTLATIVAVSIFGNRSWRLWSLLVGLVTGTATAAFFGLVDTTGIANASWIGLPDFAWPGLDLSFNGTFWALLPAFVIVTLVGAIETYGDGITIQQVSHRKPRAIDYRSVQGAVYCDGLGNLLSGLGGTLPSTTYSTSIAVADLTGVAANRIGVYGGIILTLLAFSPKVAQTLMAVPDPVVGAYIIVLVVYLFMHGLRLAIEDGMNYETILIVGLSFWLGVGFQEKVLFNDLLPGWAQTLLSNGMTSGTLIAVLLATMFRMKRGRPARLHSELAVASVPEVHAFVERAGKRSGWDASAINRLQLAAEEALVIMIDRMAASDQRQVRIEARHDDGQIELDIICAPRDTNLEDALPHAVRGNAPPEEALPFKILASIVDDFRHQQFHGIDFVTLRISGRKTG